jgi:hypothetical protein
LRSNTYTVTFVTYRLSIDAIRENKVLPVVRSNVLKEITK